MEVEVVTLAAGAVLEVDPIGIGCRLVDAYKQLQAAMEAAKLNTDICQDICDTIISVGPLVVEIASIAHVYSASKPRLVAALNYALSACVRAANDACHEIYSFLQHGRLTRVMKASGMTAFLKEKRKILRHRLQEIHMHISTAAFLHQRDAEVQLKSVAQDVAAIRSLQATLEAMRGPARSQDVSRVQAVARAQVQRRTEKGQRLEGIDDEIRMVAWSPDGRTLAAGTESGTVELWGADSGEKVRAIHCHSEKLASVVAWSSDGKMVATGSGCTAAVWDVGTGECVRVLEGHTGRVLSVAWSPGGDTIATASEEKTAALWDAQSGERVRVLTGHTQAVRSVAWSPDGQKVATGSGDKTAVLWSASTGEHLMVLHSSDAVNDVAWSPDGGTLAMHCGIMSFGSVSVIIFSVQTGQRIQTFDKQSVACIAWHPGGKMLATGLSNTVTIRSVESGEWLREVKVSKAGLVNVVAVAWSPDGSTIVSASISFKYNNRSIKYMYNPMLHLHHVALE